MGFVFNEPSSFLCLYASETNANAPNIFPWSVIASAGIFWLTAFLNRLCIEAAPSNSEYCVCTCKWENFGIVYIFKLKVPGSLTGKRIKFRSIFSRNPIYFYSQTHQTILPIFESTNLTFCLAYWVIPPNRFTNKFCLKFVSLPLGAQYLISYQHDEKSVHILSYCIDSG